jgi:hypothetical protein
VVTSIAWTKLIAPPVTQILGVLESASLDRG